MSTYRDEREATLAQNAALQQQVAVLERDTAQLREQNAALTRENESLRSAAGLPPRRRRAPRFFVAIAAVIALIMAGALALFTVRTSDSVQPTVVPTSLPPPIPPTPPPPPTPTPTSMPATPT